MKWKFKKQEETACLTLSIVQIYKTTVCLKTNPTDSDIRILIYSSSGNIYIYMYINKFRATVPVHKQLQTVFRHFLE